MAGQRPIGRGIKELIFGREGVKYDIHKYPYLRSLIGIKLVNQQPHTTECTYQYVIKGNYGIASGPAYSTSIRYFCTNKFMCNQWKNNEDFSILQWMQKEIQKNNNNNQQSLGDTLNAVIKEVFKPKSTTISNSNNNKSALNPFDNKTIRIDAKITITCKKDYHSCTNDLKKLYSERRCNSRNFSLQTECKKLIVTNNNYLSISPNNSSLICYKEQDSQISIFVKHYHDWKFPDFTPYRLNQCKDPEYKANRSEAMRKLPTLVIYTLFGLGLSYGFKSHGSHYIFYMAASADVLALAKIEINISEIPEGRTSTFKWRGKPLFIRHRTQEQIDRERSVDIGTLRDPEKDEDRVKDPKWLVVIGICTHLGCVPIADAGDYPGGYYCPCHGSHFDGSGRTRKGPAPTNMEIPTYHFEDENTIVVG